MSVRKLHFKTQIVRALEGETETETDREAGREMTLLWLEKVLYFKYIKTI